MGAENFIAGKKDDHHHDGRRSTLRRLFRAEDSLRDYQNADDIPDDQEIALWPPQPIPEAHPKRASSAEERHSLYFSLFHGGQVPYSALVEQSPMMRPTVDVLISSGLVHAQEFLTEAGQDTMLSIPRREDPHGGD